MLKLLFILIAFNQAFVHSQVRDDAKNINPEGKKAKMFKKKLFLVLIILNYFKVAVVDHLLMPI
jgi:hypothetical protein